MQHSPQPGGDLKESPDPDQLPRNTILLGDVRERLRELPTASIDCAVTSPPYFGVRNYGQEQQLGAEATIHEWVAELRAVCHELARVLRPTGSLWLNVGDTYAQRPSDGATRKSLLLGPARLALALMGDKWIIRNQVIWAKSNPMPSSTPDRLSATHEYFLFLTRSRSYYFNLDAIRVPIKTTAHQTTSDPGRTYPPAEARQTWRTVNSNSGLSTMKASGAAGYPLGKNPGDVWTLATAGYRGGHFAVFPITLAERPILTTCPERVCTACGQPWRRERQPHGGRLLATGPLIPACQCNASWRPGIVLDPFFGSGTVGVAAERHHRDWIGVELNPAYVALAEQRLRAERRHRARVKR